MVKNVIFDIGKVLISFDYEDYARKLFDEKTAQAVIDATWHNESWNELDRGVMSFEEALDLFVSNAPEYEEQIRTIINQLELIPKMYDYTIGWVDELKEMGLNVYYLSNYFEYLRVNCPQVLKFTEHMDGGIFSYNEKIIKPDHESYRRLCARYKLDKSESIFIDDSPKNIRGAESFGIRAFLFEGYEKTYPRVMEYIKDNR